MGRSEAIARSIVRTILNAAKKKSRSPIAFLLTLISTIFSFFQLPLHKHRPELFANLREQCWQVDEDEYLASFRGGPLSPMADMGFSGSSFFSTADHKFLVKSVPRHHEHTFFRDDLLDNYASYMRTHPTSLIVRICEFLASSGLALGHQLGTAPNHHIVMENIMYGQEQAKRAGAPEWESWDLKPTSYFYPERDIADGMLTSEATKDQLADEFNSKIILSPKQAQDFWRDLEEDTRMLAHYNAVDYSLFLVRINAEASAHVLGGASSSTSAAEDVVNALPRDPPAVPPEPPSWRTGVPSVDGKHVYRAAVLDFFWAKHKAQPRVMTFLVNTYNKLVHHHGPMSITTTPEEYRERFLKLCHDIVQVREVG